VAEPDQPLVDEIELALDPDLVDPPAVALLPVADPVPVTRAVTARNPLIIAGDGDGIVDAAAAGALSSDQLLLSSAWFTGGPGDPAVLNEALDSDADLLVTDTNRRRAARWGTLRENNGYTELEGEQTLTYDPTDQRLDVFPGAGDDTRSVTVVRASPGKIKATAQATAWGNPVTLTPDDRPMAALDGDPTTAWRVGAVDDPIGERLVIELAEPVTTDQVTLLQPTTLSRNRWITGARLHLFEPGNAADPASSIDVVLDDTSRDATVGGQTFTFPTSSFERLEIEITATNTGRRPRYDGQSGVGLAEVTIDGVAGVELVRTPVDLLDAVGTRDIDHRLMYLLSRLRSNPAEPVRGDPETAIRRLIDVPSPRQFSLSGTARVSAFIDDADIDALLGLPAASDGGVTATSSERLPGSLRHRASAAIDGDPDTFWSSPFEQYDEIWLDFTTSEPVTFDSADLTVVTDGRHSVPTRVRVDIDDGTGSLVTAATVDLPELPDTDGPNSTTDVAVPLDSPVTSTRVRVVVEQTRQVLTTDWYSNAPVVMPVGIAEVAIEGLTVSQPATQFASGCRDDLLTVNDTPVGVEVSGTVADAVARRPLGVTTCGGTAVAMGPGEQVMVATDGRLTGLDLDQLLFASAAGGDALDAGDLPRQLPPGPGLDVDANGRVTTSGSVDGSDEPWWLVQGQSWSSGWQATIADTTLGEPVLVNGFANGWLVSDPPAAASAFTVEWTPQRIVWVALGISAIGVVLVLACMVIGRRQRLHRVRSSVLPELPTADWLPWSAPSTAMLSAGWPTTLIGAGVVAGVAVVNLPAGWEWLALPIAALGAVALRWSRARALPAAVALGAFGLSAAFTVIQQYRNRYPADFVWPAEFDRAHVLGVVALLALGVVALHDLIERRRLDPPAIDPPDSSHNGAMQHQEDHP